MSAGILTNISERLGVDDDVTLKKAKEFIRLFQSKGSVKNLNDIARTVLCLDLASSYTGIGFDKKIALQLSGLKKSAYQNNLHIVEKVLEVDKQLTISELCVQLSCTVVKDLAQEIFETYRDSNSKIKDLHHPQYVAASIYTACKLKNIKVQNQQFATLSHLKLSQWKELTAEFDKFAASMAIASPQRRKKNEKLEDDVDEIAMEIDSQEASKKKNVEGNEIEDYETWRKRILGEAYAALKNDENPQ